eukprot:UN01769
MIFLEETALQRILSVLRFNQPSPKYLSRKTVGVSMFGRDTCHVYVMGITGTFNFGRTIYGLRKYTGYISQGGHAINIFWTGH